ncbi:HepT-like ribonuclease domain-containing protein [Serinicoccus kebangsaanensis]|uniref:HepT-like ribonuclease domain-containing protein n=1 Tax=Serinicoccus kebangsaanensis TaxID=2602069 RepID=UPI00178C1CFC|nr:DUF86 domain-containing protein [Serinicoccus kebangsaanensis]
MSRSEQERFTDILHAVERCRNYTQHLDSDDLQAMAYDAVLRNLALIGEAVRALPSETRDRAPEVPWAAIAGLRNVVVHEYFRIDPELILDIVNNQLEPLADRLRQL